MLAFLPPFSSDLSVWQRLFFITLGDDSSANTGVTCEMPQGSILDPFLPGLYMLPQEIVIREHGINFHSYADDKQLYIFLSPNDNSLVDKLAPAKNLGVLLDLDIHFESH